MDLTMKLFIIAAAFVAITMTQPALAADADLDWSIASGPSLDATINVGDTVTWTWADALPHTAESTGGTETFDSGLISGLGMQFSHTFTAVGSTDYICGVHGGGTMGGTITVLATVPALGGLGMGGLFAAILGAVILASKFKRAKV